MLAVAPVPTRTRPATTPRRAWMLAAAASEASRARPARSRRSAPARVVSARLPTRSRRGRAKASSSWRTCRGAALEPDVQDANERGRRLSAGGARDPEVVAEWGGRVGAWASLNSFNLRHCYDPVGDISVYVERSWRGKGVGRMVLARLVELGR